MASPVAIAVVGVMLSLLSFVVSAWSFVRSSPDADHRRKQQAAMRGVISNFLLTFDCLLNILIFVQSKEENPEDGPLRSQTGDQLVSGIPEYILRGHIKNAERLDSAIEEALKIGLWSVLVIHNCDDPEAATIMATKRFGVFRASLRELVDDGLSRPGLSITARYNAGMTRLLMTCAAYCEQNLHAVDPSGVILRELRALLLVQTKTGDVAIAFDN